MPKIFRNRQIENADKNSLVGVKFKKQYRVKLGLTPAGRGIFATRNFKKIERIFKFEGIKCGETTGAFSRNSLQVADGVFIEPFSDNPGRYVNHSCDPNCGIRERERDDNGHARH